MELMVATPSFASLLLMDQSFCKDRLPSFNAVFFAGNRFLPGQRKSFWSVFPVYEFSTLMESTECTVAVTAAEIEPKRGKIAAFAGWKTESRRENTH